MVRRGVAAEASPDRLTDVLADLVDHPTRREEMGAGARRFVEEGRGATEASALLVLDLLDAGTA
jgi:hypothetical protein